MDPARAVPKYLSIARQIEAEFRAGLWRDGQVPSSRQVAGTHKVSIVTASRALQVLRDKGLIRTVERAGSFVESASPAAGERWALLLRSTPGPWQQASGQAARLGFEAIARRDGAELDDEAFRVDATTSPQELRRRALKAAKAGVAGLFLMPSRQSDESARHDESLLVACRDASLPVVLVERNLRGWARPLEHDLVATDDLDGGLRSTNHLLDSGRRRIAFIAGSPTSSHEGRIAGYLKALLDRPQTAPPLVLFQQDGLPTKAAFERLAEQVLAGRCDGVVCYQDYTAIGLIMELLTRGVRIPDDVAVTGFDDLPIGSSFALGVTTYTFPGEAIASQAVRVLKWRREKPSARPIKVLVPGDLIVRESSVPRTG